MIAGNDDTTRSSDGSGRPQGVLEAEKSRLAGRLNEFSETVRDAGRRFGDDNAVARLAGQAADTMERAGDYFQSAEPRKLINDVTALARRRPEIFIGAALLAGVVLGRFLRSQPVGGSDSSADSDNDSFSDGSESGSAGFSSSSGAGSSTSAGMSYGTDDNGSRSGLAGGLESTHGSDGEGRSW